MQTWTWSSQTRELGLVTAVRVAGLGFRVNLYLWGRSPQCKPAPGSQQGPTPACSTPGPLGDGWVWGRHYVPPLSRCEGSGAKPRGQREPNPGWQLPSGKAPAGRAAPRQFLAANCVLNGLPWPHNAGPASRQAGEVGVGPFPHPRAQVLGRCCFEDAFFFCSLSLGNGCLAGQGWCSIALVRGRCSFRGCRRSLLAGSAAREHVEMLKRELWSRAVHQLWVL